VRELQQDVVSRGGTVLIGNCYEETRAIPYYPFRNALKHYFEINKEEAVSIFKNLPGYSQWELKQIIPGLRKLKAPEFERTSNKYRLYEAIRLFLENVSDTPPLPDRQADIKKGGHRGIAPLVFILEDLHWADEASLDLLHYLSRNFRETSPMAGTIPILLLGTYRTEEVEPTRGVGKLITTLKKESASGGSEEIALHPLPREEVSTMLKQLTPGVEQSKEYHNDLYNKTEGNPFFVEELVKYITTENVSAMPTGRQGLSGFSKDDLETGIPTSIQGVLQRRVNSLSPEMKEVLTCGALIGDEFDIEVLRRVLKKSDEDILDAVEGGVREYFVREMEEPESGNQYYKKYNARKPESGPERYRFNHSLMSDVLYSENGKTKRRIWHGKVGEALEAVYADRLEVLNGQLSHHFELGEKWEKAVDYALKSANHAKKVYAYQEAIRMYEKAREIHPRLTRETYKEEFTISGGLAYVYQSTGEYEKALQECRMMDDSARRKGDEVKRGEGLSKIGEVYTFLGNNDMAKVCGEKAEEIHRKMRNQKELARCLIHNGNVHLRYGELGEALKYYEESLEIRRKLDNKNGMASNFNNIGLIHMNRRNYDEALKYFKKSLEIHREIGDKMNLSNNLNNIGNVHAALVNYGEALKAYEESLSIRREIGDKRGMASSLNNIGLIYGNQGDFGKTSKCFEESLTIYREIENKLGTAWCLSDMGTHHQYVFDLEKAKVYHKESITLMEKMGAKTERTRVLLMIGIDHHLSGDNEKALVFLNEVLVKIKNLNYREMEPEVLSAFSEVWLSKEDTVKADEYCDRLLKMAENESLKGYLVKGRKIKGEILLQVALGSSSGSKTAGIRQKKSKTKAINKNLAHFASLRETRVGILREAEKELKEALRIAEEIEAKPLLWQIHASLGKVYVASDGKDSKKKAKEQFTKSKEIIQKIASTIGDKKLKKTFLSAKQVKSVAVAVGSGSMKSKSTNL
jgi:tetratricopeptide (TPR) repeat protein